MSTNRKTCFVIMPFSKTTGKHTKAYWTKHYTNFLKPLIEENPNLEAHRSEALRGDILRQIITDLVASPVVVADLTDNNCNVYWELGVRQSFKHGTVTIAEEGTALPFDIFAKATLFYDPKDHLEMENFRMRFKEAIQDCLQHSDRPDSHVLETLSGRGTLFEIFHRDEAIRRLEAVLSECNMNLQLLAQVVARARKNKENPKERAYITTRFRASAADLLATTRYVDEDEAFFTMAASCVDRLTALNDRLNAWSNSPNVTGEWLLGRERPVNRLLGRFRDRVAAARDNLSERC